MDYTDYIGNRRPGREDHSCFSLGIGPPFFRQRAASASLCRSDCFTAFASRASASICVSSAPHEKLGLAKRVRPDKPKYAAFRRCRSGNVFGESWNRRVMISHYRGQSSSGAPGKVRDLAGAGFEVDSSTSSLGLRFPWTLGDSCPSPRRKR